MDIIDILMAKKAVTNDIANPASSTRTALNAAVDVRRPIYSDATKLALAGDSFSVGWEFWLGYYCGLPQADKLGVSSQTSAQISARLGGVRARLKVTAATIAATGSTTVTGWTVNPCYGHDLDASGLHGTLAGVPGKLFYAGWTNATDGTMTFVRDTGGSAVACPDWSEFICDHEAYTDRMVVAWAYHNDDYLLTAPDETVANLRAMRERAAPQVKRFALLECCPADTWLPATPQRAAFDNRRTAVKSAFPDIIPAYTWLMTDEAYALADVKKTADDITDIGNGIVGRSLRRDSLHLSSVAQNYGVGRYVARELFKRGWHAKKPYLPQYFPGVAGMAHRWEPGAGSDDTNTVITTQYDLVGGGTSHLTKSAGTPAATMKLAGTMPYLETKGLGRIDSPTGVTTGTARTFVLVARHGVVSERIAEFGGYRLFHNGDGTFSVFNNATAGGYKLGTVSGAGFHTFVISIAADGVTLAASIDGAEVTLTPSSGGLTNTETRTIVTVGGDNAAYTVDWALAGIYNRETTAAERADIYNAIKAAYGTSIP